VSGATPRHLGDTAEPCHLGIDSRRVLVAHVRHGLRGIELLAATREALGQQLAVVGELGHVARPRPVRLAAEARHALGHVGLEADAALLAVIADVDAELALLAEHEGDAAFDLGVELGAVDALAELGTDQQLVEPAATRQAPDMRHQDPLVAPAHRAPIAPYPGGVTPPSTAPASSSPSTPATPSSPPAPWRPRSRPRSRPTSSPSPGDGRCSRAAASSAGRA